MATQKKGCGFIIAALVLLLLGGGIATFLGMSAVSTSSDFADNLNAGKAFVTPLPMVYTAEETQEVTVWMTVDDSSRDLSGIEIEVTEKGSGTTTTAEKAKSSNNMGNQYYIASFDVEKGKDYMVSAKGVPAGETFRVSNISSSVVLSVLGKGFGAIGIAMGSGFIALILGIIGLVKFLGSKKSTPPAPAA